MAISKYELYERAVQSAKTHVKWFVTIYKEIHHAYPRQLREDFCGTFQISCEWVKRNRKNTALGIDLDPDPLAYGKRKNLAKLSAGQRRRLRIAQANVLNPTLQKHDLIYAGNFSFFTFKKRIELLSYFRGCLDSLNSRGTLILELAGGPGMIATGKETKTVKISKSNQFLYIWNQKKFNPISRNGLYSISFKLPNKKVLKDVFEYDWRLWTIPETRDMLEEAGFSRSYVYWETEYRGRGTGEFIQSEEADNAYSWIAYIVAVR